MGALCYFAGSTAVLARGKVVCWGEVALRGYVGGRMLGWLVGWLGSLCIGSEVFVCTLSSLILLERGFCTCVVRVVMRGCEV